MLSPADLVDLHTHSQASDGADTPETLVRSAAEDGIRALALTDHDCIDGLEQFLMACHKYAVAGIPGVEVSVKFMEFRMHIVGLGLRRTSGYDHLMELLEQARIWRDERNQAIVDRFCSLKVPMTIDEVNAEAGGEVIARPHFARVLMKKGIVRSIPEAFERFLRKGGTAYVPKRKLDAKMVVDALRSAQCIVILAHPVSMLEGTSVSLEEALQLSKELGVDGFEAFHPDVQQGTRRRIIRYAQTNSMLVSGGSDYHGGNKPLSFLGRASGNRPIWARDVWPLLQKLSDSGWLSLES